MKPTMQTNLFLATLLGRLATAQTPPSFDWDSISPSTSLAYTDCYGAFKCAKLSVPLDWLDESSNGTNGTDRVSLAILKLPAVVNDTDPTFGGTIITNPGGPGGSGVEFVLLAGSRMQSVADGEKHYEILSFDPRGVG